MVYIRVIVHFVFENSFSLIQSLTLFHSPYQPGAAFFFFFLQPSACNARAHRHLGIGHHPYMTGHHRVI